MAKINILRDAIRKKRVGLISQEEMIRVFQYVEERATAYTQNFSTYRNKLRKYEGGRLKLYESKVFEIGKAIAANKFEKVIDIVAEARAIREDIEEGLDAIEAYDTAIELLKSLKNELGAKWLNQMPSIITLEKTLIEADQLMSEDGQDKKYQQALTLISFCAVETKRIKDSFEENIHGYLFQEIDNLKEICKDTACFARSLKLESLEIEGKVEVMLAMFIEQEQLNLVRKLVDDLKFVLKGRKSFWERVKSHPEIVDAHRHEILEALKNGGWTAGANYILVQRSKEFKVKLETTAVILEKVQAAEK